MSRCAVIVPVLARPQNAQPLVDSFKASGADADLFFVVSPGDEDEWDACWNQMMRKDVSVGTLQANFTSGPGDYARKIQYGYEFTVAHELVLLAADDLIFHPGWLEAVERIADEYDCGVIGTNDMANPLVKRGLHSTHPVVRRCYIDTHGGVVGEPGTVYHQGYDHQWCNPPEAPIWMADLSFRDLGDVSVGDEVIGWQRWPEITGFKRLCRSRVLGVTSRSAPIVKVTMKSGSVIRCTEDHRWFNANFSPSSAVRLASEWVTPLVGRSLLRAVIDPGKCAYPREAGWLGGIYDGEGHGVYAAMQSPEKNADICAEIERVMHLLEIPFTRALRAKTGMGSVADSFMIKGGRPMYLKFLLHAQPIKRTRLTAKILNTARFGQKDQIVSVEPDGEGEVVSMQTETGNYIAWGYASKNCDVELVETAKTRGCYAHAHDAIVEHRHPLYDRKVQSDETYKKGQAKGADDRRLFELRKHLWLTEG